MSYELRIKFGASPSDTSLKQQPGKTEKSPNKTKAKIGGPRPGHRLLVSRVISSIRLYATPVWAKALEKEIWNYISPKRTLLRRLRSFIAHTPIDVDVTVRQIAQSAEHCRGRRTRLISMPEACSAKGRIRNYNRTAVNTRKHHGTYVKIKGDMEGYGLKLKRWLKPRTLRRNKSVRKRNK